MSTAPSTRATRLRLPDQTVARLKLSIRALRPDAETSNISFGYLEFPFVTYEIDPERPVVEPQVDHQVVGIL